jgi:3-oxoacyl-[acyl-carrier protein] reductase
MNENILKNKNCFLTGATGGLGVELAKELARESCNLFLTSNTEEKLIKLKGDLKKINPSIKILYKKCDLSKIEDIQKLITHCKESLFEVDILINSAGVFQIKSLEDSSLIDFDNCFNINLKAPFFLSKEFSKNMLRNKWGRIINIGSSSSYSGFKNGSLYCSSKHALLGLSRVLYNELKENNIRVICVSPGSMKTDMAKISTDQDFNTFLDPKEVASHTILLMKYDNEMVLEEVRLNRVEIR